MNTSKKPDIKCVECGEPCGTIEETFDYSGTHCTHGISGTHRTGIYVSDCCLSDYIEMDDFDYDPTP